MLNAKTYSVGATSDVAHTTIALTQNTNEAYQSMLESDVPARLGIDNGFPRV